MLTELGKKKGELLWQKQRVETKSSSDEQGLHRDCPGVSFVCRAAGFGAELTHPGKWGGELSTCWLRGAAGRPGFCLGLWDGKGSPERSWNHTRPCACVQVLTLLHHTEWEPEQKDKHKN